jgi:hypothetical protein
MLMPTKSLSGSGLSILHAIHKAGASPILRASWASPPWAFKGKLADVLQGTLGLQPGAVYSLALQCGPYLYSEAAYLVVDDGAYAYLVCADHVTEWLALDGGELTEEDRIFGYSEYALFCEGVDHVVNNNVLSAAAAALGCRLNGWDGDIDTKSPEREE